jgi:hypothetical protein
MAAAKEISSQTLFGVLEIKLLPFFGFDVLYFILIFLSDYGWLSSISSCLDYSLECRRK